MRKENSDADTGLKFKENFHQLYEMSKCQSITQFAQKLQMNRQSVDRYYNGERLPDLTSIVQICKVMDVSADWLLGISDIQSQSTDVQAVVKTLGLSEEAVKKIIDPDDIGHCKDALSHLLEQDGFFGLLADYKVFLVMVDKLNFSEEVSTESEFDYKNLTVKLSLPDTIELWKTRIADHMKNICRDEPIIPAEAYNEKTGWRYPRKDAIEKKKKGEKIDIKAFLKEY